MYKERDYLMWLSCFTNIGIAKLNKLLEQFGSAENVYRANSLEISEIINIRERNLFKIISSKTDEFMENNLSFMEKNNISFIGICDEDYPDLLRDIDNPPVGLYIIGKMPDKDIKRISIIGSRECSSYGSRVAYKTAMELAASGTVVVSGMAEGIDGIAHRGALDGGGKTIAVLGNGVDICYPASNKNIRERIIQNGCLISEYPPKMQPLAYHFPERNRIISGISDVVLVVEAKEKSGTLITVDEAFKQGRYVFSVPGNINSDRSVGTNQLLKQGVRVFTQTNDILDVLRIEKNEFNKINNKIYEDDINKKEFTNNRNIDKRRKFVNGKNIENDKNNKNIENTLATDEKLVYDCIGFEPISVDELVIKTKKEVSVLQYTLTVLEIKGIIQKVSGQSYIRE